VLEGEDLSDEAREHVGEVIERLVSEYTPGDFVEDWDVPGLFAQVEQLFPTEIDPSELSAEQIERAELVDMLATDALEMYGEREDELGEELMRALERYLLLQIIDERWREHLYDMDYLREGIHLRGFAQIEPLVAYKNEAFTLFNDLMNGIWTDFVRMVFNVEGDARGRQRRGRRRLADTRQPGCGLVLDGVGARVLFRRWPRGRRRGDRDGLGRGGRGGRGIRGRRGFRAGDVRPAAARRAAPCGRARADRAQRPVLVRVGQEIQEVPRRLMATPASEPTPQRLAAIRDQLKLLADYL